jgi:arginyl-tRNA synthetase
VPPAPCATLLGASDPLRHPRRSVREVLQRLTRALSAAAPGSGFSVIPLHNPRKGADVQVFFRPADADGRSADAGEMAAAREALGALGEVAAVRAKGDALMVRFTDESLARLGERLEAGDAAAMDTRDLMKGAGVLVNFCDANPTKALHIGHLRNIALGQALAAALTAAGARVTRQSQVSDYCRSMGEALAGYSELPAHITPRALGVKSDHFVGECFARYAAAGGGPPDPSRENDAGDPALRAEEAVRDDLAEELLRRLSEGDEAVVERWKRLRGWALEGQDATLRALGVRIDRTVSESDSRPLTRWIVEKGLTDGTLTKAENGAVVYETGDAEYPRLLLARPDGFPTQHLRTFALWRSLRGSLNGTRSIELVGEEWHAYVRYHDPLMKGIAPSEERRHPTTNVIYGMVTVEGGPVKSSSGRPPLVDGLLERLARSSEVEALAARSEGRFRARRLAALIALGLYLGRPTRKPVDLTLTEMLECRGGVGWDLARAAVHAWNPRHDGPPDPAPEEASYRRTVMQSRAHREHLRRAVEQLDSYETARFYGHVSRRYLAGGGGDGNGDGDARTARAMRTLLAAGCGALGLPSATAEDGGNR